MMSLMAQDGTPAGNVLRLPALNIISQPLLSSSPADGSPAASEPSATTLVQEEDVSCIMSLRETMSRLMDSSDINSVLQDLQTTAPGPQPGFAAAPGPAQEPASHVDMDVDTKLPAPAATLSRRVSFQELISQYGSPCAGSGSQLSLYDSPCSSAGAAVPSTALSAAGAHALLQGSAFGPASAIGIASVEPEGRVKAGRLHHRFSGSFVASPPSPSLDGARLASSAGGATGPSSLTCSPAASLGDFPLPPPSMWPEPHLGAKPFAFATSEDRPRLKHSQSLSHRTMSLSAQCLSLESKPPLAEPKVRAGSSSGSGVAGKDCRVRGGSLPGHEAAAQANARTRAYFHAMRSTCSIPELQELESLLERGFCSAPLAHMQAQGGSGSPGALWGQSLASVGELSSIPEPTAAAEAALIPSVLAGPSSEGSSNASTSPLLFALSLPAQGNGYKVKLLRSTSSSMDLSETQGLAMSSCDP